MYTWILVFLLCSWKIETLFLKLEVQKLQIMQLEQIVLLFSVYTILQIKVWLIAEI